MAYKAYTLTIATPAVAVRLSTVLPDALAHNELYTGPGGERKAGLHDDALIQVTLELVSGTAGFVGHNNLVSATNYGGKFTTSKSYVIEGGCVRLGDLWVIGTAGDVVAIGALDL